MALSILDGNQSATTLSTILTSGQHITAHTVVSLGTQAITDMRGAVSGSVVSISNLPATQTIAGTVTANVQPQQSDDTDPNIKFIPIGYATVDGGGQLDQWTAVDPLSPLPVYFPSNNPLPAGTNRIGVVTIGGGTVTIGAGTSQIGSVTVGNTVTISGTVTASPTGTQTIAGTVTANGLAVGATVANVFPIGVDTQFSGVRSVTDLIGYRLPISLGDSSAVVSASLSDPLPTGTNRIGVVTIGAGTVTIGAGTAQIGSVTVGNTVTISGTVTANPTGTQTIAGTVTANVSDVVGGGYSTLVDLLANETIAVRELPAISGTVTIGSLPAISGTVTANLAISSTAITSGSFTSLTSATLVPANTARKMATVYNLGAGQLFVNAGATATTLGGGFMVALSSGDFYECDYTTTTLSAIFATAGTASWVSH